MIMGGGMHIERARRRVRLRDLETLVTVVQAGGMRKAAGQLNLSQPAVSKAVAELEDALGLTLLQRGRQGVEPTAFGTALVRRSEALIDGVRDALRELTELADPESGEIRLGAIETVQAGVIGATLSSVLARHPRIRVVMEIGQSADLVDHFLLRRRIDFAVARPYFALPPELEGEALFHDRLQVVVGQAHPLARKRKLRLPDLMHENWILSRNEVLHDSPVVEAFRDEGLDLPARLIIAGGLAQRYTMLGTGRFVTCMPHSLTPFVPAWAGLRTLPVRIPPWSRATMVLKLRDRTLSPSAELFLAMLRQRAKALSEAAA
jgi:DNA-binding transcriptional LysR family regulator